MALEPGRARRGNTLPRAERGGAVFGEADTAWDASGLTEMERSLRLERLKCMLRVVLGRALVSREPLCIVLPISGCPLNKDRLF